MIATITLIGIGLIVALGGVILLDRERFNHRPRHAYRLATVSGMAIAVLGMML